MNQAPSTNSGILLIDKPTDWTSFDVVAKLRSITGIRKIGHAGTLDPFATGLLIVAIGRESTKEIAQFMKQDKVYESIFILGSTSTTHDPEGEITHVTEHLPETTVVEQAIKTFVGNLDQIPPMHAAIKVDGTPLYKLARRGEVIERKPRAITIHSMEMLTYAPPHIKLRIHCSTGTYIRAIARDLGEKLGVGAYASQLRRTQIGEHNVRDAIKIDRVTPDNWRGHLI